MGASLFSVFAELTGNGKAQPVFEGLQVQAELRETLAITSISQSYRNTTSKNMEVVYTFPLPLDAVLLDMTVTLGNKTLTGMVMLKQKAEKQYQKAIADGDAPIMLQNPQPGVYTMNLGNLSPQENAKITIRYGTFQFWQGDTLRYHLPTTIAPRYGSSKKARFKPQQNPETSLLVENIFTFEMRIIGDMAERLIESPSHKVVIERGSEGKESVVSFVQKSACMYRDLVITVKKGNQQAASATVEREGDEYLLWGSFQPQFELVEDSSPRSINVVVDCSASMMGDSIAQARIALLRILDELRPQDWFNIVCFGTEAIALFNTQTKADKESLSYARGFFKKLDADMGRTKMGGALEMTEQLRCPERIQQDVLIITNGEIWEWEKVVARALESGHRYFTVGVGSSVSEAFLKTLAEQTGGSCELIAPNENISERIYRHFKRIYASRSSDSEGIWPEIPLRIFPEIMPCVYDGDTCNIFAWYAKPPVGKLQLKISLPDNTVQVQSADISPFTEKDDSDMVISRMAAALKLCQINEEETGQKLAVKYQLVSRWTNYLAIVIRDNGEKADTQPQLHKVQQMLATGWGGIRSARKSSSGPCSTFIDDDDYYDRPDLFPIKTPDESERHNLKGPFLDLLDMTLNEDILPTSIRFPLLPAYISSVLTSLVEEGFDEQVVVIIFLYSLATSTIGRNLSQQAKLVISKAYMELQVDHDTVKFITERFKLVLRKAAKKTRLRKTRTV